MYDLIDDLQKFTSIPLTQLRGLKDKSELDISHCIAESYKTGESCAIDLGIGVLAVDYDDGDALFKFIPSATLQDRIVRSIENDKSDLQLAIESSCTQKMLKVYKELF